MLHFLKTLKVPRWEDYEIAYKSRNRFAYLGGRGLTVTETEDGRDVTPYIRNYDTEYKIE